MEEDRVLFCTECLHVVNRHYQRKNVDDEIRRLRQQGRTWRQISKEVGLSVMGVRRRFLKSFGEDHPLLQDPPSLKKKKETTILAYALHEGQGLSYSEIAKWLGISVTTAKQKVHREKVRLGECQR